MEFYRRDFAPFYKFNLRWVVVNWITAEDNDIMIECGEDFGEDMENLEFNMLIGD